MEAKFSLKVLLRSPIKTVVTFLLLAAVSAAFVSRGAEFVTTLRAVGSAEGYYEAGGTIRATQENYEGYVLYSPDFFPEFMPLAQEAVDLVQSSKYVERSEVRRTAGGRTSDGYFDVVEQPLYEAATNGSGELLGDDLRGCAAALIASCTDVSRGAVKHLDGGETPGHLDAEIKVEELIAGMPQWNGEGRELVLKSFARGWKESETWFADPEVSEWGEYSVDNSAIVDQIVPGHRYFLVVEAESIGQRPASDERKLSMKVDYPLIDLTRLEEEHGTDDWRAALADPEKYGLVRFKGDNSYPSVREIKDKQLVPVGTYMERLNLNAHTQELVYTGDMESLMRFWDGREYITEGRALGPSDSGNVCVVNALWAQQNGFALGDSVEFTVSADTMMHSGKLFARRLPVVDGYMPDIAFLEIQAYSDLGLEPVMETFEIVGLWADSITSLRERDPYAYPINTVFLPEDAYPWPDSVEQPLMPSTFNFTLKHPGDVEKIESELSQELAELGYELVIDDMGYAETRHSLEMMKTSALVGFAAMSGALMLALAVTVYLFITRRKQDYAVMRAMGTSVRRANMSLFVGLFVLAAAAICVGCAAATVITRDAGAELAARLTELTGEDVRASLSYLTVCAFGAGELVLLMLAAAFGLRRVGRKPPLELLQGEK